MANPHDKTENTLCDDANRRPGKTGGKRGDAAVAAHVQTPPNRRVDVEEQDVELVNFDRSVWLDVSRSGSLVAARSQPPVFPGLGLNLISSLTWRMSPFFDVLAKAHDSVTLIWNDGNRAAKQRTIARRME